MTVENSPEKTTSIPKINKLGEPETEAIALRSIDGTLNQENFALLSEQEREIVSSLQANTAMLIAITGPAKGSRVLLDQNSHLLGRSPEADIFLDDITVSRKHGFIERDGSVFEIVDTNSLNGIYLNNEIIKERATLKRGDEIQIGKYKFTFFTGVNLTDQSQGEKL